MATRSESDERLQKLCAERSALRQEKESVRERLLAYEQAIEEVRAAKPEKAQSLAEYRAYRHDSAALEELSPREDCEQSVTRIDRRLGQIEDELLAVLPEAVWVSGQQQGYVCSCSGKVYEASEQALKQSSSASVEEVLAQQRHLEDLAEMGSVRRFALAHPLGAEVASFALVLVAVNAAVLGLMCVVFVGIGISPFQHEEARDALLWVGAWMLASMPLGVFLMWLDRQQWSSNTER